MAIFTEQKVDQFRIDFDNAIKELSIKYGANFKLGAITWETDEFRCKMTVINADKAPITNDDPNKFVIGETVAINHNKIAKNLRFVIVKKNRKKWQLEEVGNNRILNCPPSLIIKG